MNRQAAAALQRLYTLRRHYMMMFQIDLMVCHNVFCFIQENTTDFRLLIRFLFQNYFRNKKKEFVDKLYNLKSFKTSS